MYLALTIPALVLMILFIAAPLVNAVRISFFKWNGYSQKMRWYGLKNFENIFTDKLFWLTTLNTFIYGFGSTILQNILGLAAALFLNNKFKGRNAVRVILYMPIMISAFIMGQILYYFVQVEGGVFNELLGLLGLSGVYWMKTGLSSTIMITLANSWQYMGLCMIIYLAGLQNIPSITTAVVTNLIGGFKLFDAIVAMSGGGPNRKSMSLSFYISQLYFNDEKAGYASAVGIMTFFIILIVALPVNMYLRKKEVEY